MSWKHWAAVILVIGVGIVLQIPGHDAPTAHDGAGHGSHPAPTESEANGPYRTITLEVTGMT
jgi:hypothetical protein